MYAQAVITDFLVLLNSCFSYLKKITPIHTRNKNVHPFLTFFGQNLKQCASSSRAKKLLNGSWFIVLARAKIMRYKHKYAICHHLGGNDDAQI